MKIKTTSIIKLEGKMKLNVCDVCYYETNVIKEKKIVQSRYRISFKNGMGKRLALDVCEEHRNFFKVCKTFDEAEKKVNKLYGFGE